MIPQDGNKIDPGWDEEPEKVVQADLRSVRRLLDDIIRENRLLGIELSAPALASIVEHMWSCDTCFMIYNRSENAR